MLIIIYVMCHPSYTPKSVFSLLNLYENLIYSHVILNNRPTGSYSVLSGKGKYVGK